MTPEEAAAHNARFAAPPTIDVSTFRMMGLAVVSRLAYRHGIQVQLQGNPAGGTVVELKMPGNVLVLPVTRQLPAVRRSRPPAHAQLHQRNRHAREPADELAGVHGHPVRPRRPRAGPSASTSRRGRAGSAHRRPAGTAQPAIAVQPAVLQAGDTGRPVGRLSGPAEHAPTGTAAARSRPTTPPRCRSSARSRRRWFRTHGHSASGGWPPANGRPAEPARCAPRHTAPGRGDHRRPGRRESARHGGRATPRAARPTTAGESADIWRTRADAGWRAAAAAATPPVKDRTRSGLPKRQPRAQLVPGGVSERPATRAAPGTPRRSAAGSVPTTAGSGGDGPSPPTGGAQRTRNERGERSMSGTGHMHRMSWLLNTFAQEVAGVAHVIVVSVDGLLLAASDELPDDRAEQLAAITAGLVSLTYGVSRHFDGGEVHQTIVDMDQGSLITMAIGDGSSIAVLAARQTRRRPDRLRDGAARRAGRQGARAGAGGTPSRPASSGKESRTHH